MKRLSAILLICAVMASSLLCGCAGNKKMAYPTTLEELDGLRVGLKVGSLVDTIVKNEYPNSKEFYFNTNSDIVEALLAGKIDYSMLDEPVVNMICHENSQIFKIDQSVYDQPIGLVFSKTNKGSMLAQEFDAFFEKHREDGSLDELIDKWLSESVTDYDALEKYDPELDGNNGILNFAIATSAPPFSYADGDTYSGLEVEIVRMFCNDNGYRLNIEASEFSSVIAAVSSGKSDVGGCCLTITEERKESMNFSEPYMHLGLYPFSRKNPDTKRIYPTSVSELNGLRAGAVVGMLDDMIIEKNFPDSSIDYYNSMSDMLKAIDVNKLDYCIFDEPTEKATQIEGINVQLLKEKSLYDQKIAFAFKKGEENSKLYKNINEFINKHGNNGDGLIQSIKDKWLSDDITDLSDIEEYDPELSGKNGTVIIATDPVNTPISYLDGDGIKGMDIEICKKFAEEYGYQIEWFEVNFAGLIPAINSGKADFACSSIAITDERSAAVTFSKPYMELSLYPVVAKKAASRFSIEEIKKVFYKTFIKEGRWKMILSGLALTCKITLLSILFGTVLGFLLYILYRRNIKPFNYLVDIISKLISGLPIVVILMIAYYIVLGKSSMSGEWVSIIVFTISLMLSVNSMLSTAVKSIDNGQIEGAISLGFTNRQTLFGIVLPQAMTQFIPNYMDQLISLLHGTSIVGYIAVQDLTKVSDVIRSRTYEAFLPLVSTAIIYLIIVVLITYVISRLSRLFMPKMRSDDKVLKQYK